MNEWPREIRGETAWERAVNLAGILAERGVTRVVLEVGGARREVGARGTDLPGEMRVLLSGGDGPVTVIAAEVSYVAAASGVTRL